MEWKKLKRIAILATSMPNPTPVATNGMVSQRNMEWLLSGCDDGATFLHRVRHGDSYRGKVLSGVRQARGSGRVGVSDGPSVDHHEEGGYSGVVATARSLGSGGCSGWWSSLS